MTAPSASAQPTDQPFRRDLENAFHRLRSALTEALSAVGADPGRTRELARQLEINKNLAWRATKVATARHAMGAVAHVPGQQAFGALVAALVRAGLPAAGEQRLLQAHAAYRAMAREHSAGDKAVLEQLAAGLGSDPAAAAERQLHGRRQAFLGMGSTWGVQTRLQLLTVILGPPDPESGVLDLVVLSGFLGLRRLRADARWTLLRRRAPPVEEGQPAPVLSEPLDPDIGPEEAPLLGEFCTLDEPLETDLVGNLRTWTLPPGPVGQTAARDVLFATHHRASVRPPSAERAPESFWMSLATPAEAAQYDLIVHRDVDWARGPRAELRSQLEGLEGRIDDDRLHPRLPLAEEPHGLGQDLSAMASTHVPRYGELLARVLERTGWDAEAFRGHRLVLPYPPVPSLLALRMDEGREQRGPGA